MEDKTLFSISIEQLLQNYNGGVGIKNDIYVTSQLKLYCDIFNFPVRVNAFGFFVCTKGSMNVTINLTGWEMTKSTYLISLPENILKINDRSSDFEGFAILFSMDYLKFININLKEVLPFYVYLRNNPMFRFTTQNLIRIAKFYDLIFDVLSDEKSNQKEDIIKGLSASMIYKISEDLDEFGLSKIFVKSKSKDDYFIRFMELLQQNFRTQHEVSFYSDRLSLTPKYLSSMMKEISGMSASQWINEYIIMEAKTMLKTSDMNVKQIAYYLSFPNPSFFSKYFKQYVGCSPSEFKEN
ncbi:AraC family transcriptional regulator [Roseimarinus sediminis]|uniref:AraC family transcriptional regulator n=1 Tax=Roseimarinus sediminis TaxID=1610899 RepID=UPI003D24766F